MPTFSSSILRRSVGLSTDPSRKPIWRPSPLIRKGSVAVPAAILVLAAFIAAVLISSTWFESIFFSVNIPGNQTVTISHQHQKTHHSPPRKIQYPLTCPIGNQTQLITCRKNYPTSVQSDGLDLDPSPEPVCPDYFRWIHEDLRPWRATGITRDMVERANTTAHFRLLIVNGKIYVEHYKKSIQTRDVFTIWGILQLLRRYPGKIPDLELMFDCDDRPVIKSRDYRNPNKTGGTPPLFRYCGDRWTADIVFPDWSFWGWAEINIRPWEKLLKELKEGNERKKWMEREPFAYWKGNPYVADTRQDLLKCNVSPQHDWNARLYIQDWILESQQAYKQSDLASQCTHRYKIYIEGYAWSVSEKYILACNSVALLVKPTYYDFFTRYLQPVHHYWPVRDDDKCKSIKFAVHWGNSHKQKAQAIGKAASDFIQEELKMEKVYDYMFHLLNEYAKLLRFQPKIPEGAEEVCSEAMACPRSGLEKKFMAESLVKTPSLANPCSIPPPFDPLSLQRLYRRNGNLITQVEKWEDKYWETQPQ